MFKVVIDFPFLYFSTIITSVLRLIITVLFLLDYQFTNIPIRIKKSRINSSYYFLCWFDNCFVTVLNQLKNIIRTIIYFHNFFHYKTCFFIFANYNRKHLIFPYIHHKIDHPSLLSLIGSSGLFIMLSLIHSWMRLYLLWSRFWYNC